MAGRPFDRPRTGVAQFRVLREPTKYADGQVVAHLNLAREPRVRLSAGHALQALLFGRRDWTRLAIDHFDAAGRAAGVAAAAMQDVDTRILDSEHESSPVVGRDEGLDPLN